MSSLLRFPALVRLVVLVSLLIPFTLAGAALAQDASPVAAEDHWVGDTPDLAAMMVTPADLEAMGVPGFGRFFNGFFNDQDGVVEGTAGFYGQPVEEARGMFDRMGLRRMFGSGMGQPSVPGDDESPPVRGAYANVIEIENATEADAFFTYIEEAGAEPDAQFVAVEAPFTLGDRAMIVNYASVDPATGERYHEYSLIFRIDNLYADTGFWISLPEDLATPAAAEDDALASPAGTIAELEALGRGQLARMEAVLAGGSPNLPSLLLRVGENPLAATNDYTEGYRLLNGELLPYYAGRDDDLIADPAALTGAVAAYELEESFQRGDEFVPGDMYLLNRLYAFPDEETAAAFLASRPEALATGGFALVSDAAPESRSDLLPGEATDLGEESLALSFVRAFDDGTRAVGFEVFVRVGATVAAVSLEGPPDMPLALVTDIAASQAACLEAGACPAALPVPEPFLAVKEASSTAATSATQDATPEASAAEDEDFAGLVDIGGRSLYLTCQGQGSPTVVFEPGLDTPSDTYAGIVPDVASFTRVCVYDRANVPGGRSDPVPTPRTAADLSEDLHRLLAAADVPGPYVLVASSFGGQVSRLFAHTYPDDVAGLILLDSTHEDQDADLERTLGPELWAELLADGFQVSSEGLDFETSNQQVREARATLPLSLVPVISLTAPIPADEPYAPGWPLEMNEVWAQENADLASLVPGQRWIEVENSGHNIHYDRPDAVVDAIRQVVDAVRDPSTWERATASPVVPTTAEAAGDTGAASGDFAGLVDIGGRSLYLVCQGEESPTVLLEAGNDGGIDTWALRSDLADATGARVCAYDRANVGRSDAAPLPRTGADVVADLHALLDAAAVPGPYVIASASLGGLFTRLYAATYPDDVVGMVLLDTSYEEQDARGEAVHSPELWAILVAEWGTFRDGEGFFPDGFLSDTLVAELREARQSSPLRPMPLIVITNETSWDASGYPADWPAEAVAADNAMWRELQDEQAALVPGGRLVVSESNQHYLQQADPDLVISAISEVVDAVRDPGSWDATPAAA